MIEEIGFAERGATLGGRGLKRQSGLTLLETAVFTALAVVIGAPIASMVLTTQSFVAELDATTRVSERNRTALYRLDQEIRQAVSSSLTVSAASTLQLTLATGYDGTDVVTGDSIEYSLELDPGESANGADDNGDGLVDEGQLVRRNLTTAESSTLCGGINLSASSFVLNGTGVTVNLTHTASMRKSDSTFDHSGSIHAYPDN
jgi:hypothetical protein